MKAKLNQNTCYMAGLYSKSSKKQKNFVSISSGMQELRDRFVEIAVRDLGVLPNKIIFGSGPDKSMVGFFHSRVAKRLMDLVKREVYVFRLDNELTRSYLSGMFDAAGHIGPNGVEMHHINSNDAIMLQGLGVHSKGDRILNIRRFLDLISGRSLIAAASKIR
ncbi:MAG: hypothetical protein M1569_00255 [Candidatus Marsarchaeota archaeon]|nr:hypothetical protein [Candidatus Marsarchaeota archaeon]